MDCCPTCRWQWLSPPAVAHRTSARSADAWKPCCQVWHLSLVSEGVSWSWSGAPGCSRAGSGACKSTGPCTTCHRPHHRLLQLAAVFHNLCVHKNRMCRSRTLSPMVILLTKAQALKSTYQASIGVAGRNRMQCFTICDPLSGQVSVTTSVPTFSDIGVFVPVNGKSSIWCACLHPVYS